MSAHVYEQMQHAADFGVQASGIQLAFADVQKSKDKVVLKNSKGIEYLMKKNKVTVFKGTGKLALPGKVEVTDAEGKKQTIETKNIIIATGSVVRPIPGFETDGKHVVNSDHILELKDVPKSLIVMGAGAVGVEFASVYSRFGAETTIVELLPRLVPLEDEEVSKELERSFRKRGIKSQVDTKLEKLEKTETGVRVTGKTSKGEAGKSRSGDVAGRCRAHALHRRTGTRRNEDQSRKGFHSGRRVSADRGKGRVCDWRRGADAVAGPPCFERRHRRGRASCRDRKTCVRSICDWCQTALTAIRKSLPLD